MRKESPYRGGKIRETFSGGDFVYDPERTSSVMTKSWHILLSGGILFAALVLLSVVMLSPDRMNSGAVSSPESYAIQEFPASSVTPLSVEWPDVPEVTWASIREKIPEPVPGSAQKVALKEFPAYLAGYETADAFVDFQNREDPQAIFLDEGVFDLDALRANFPGDAYIEKLSRTVFLLKTPLFIDADATLVLTDGQELRLETATGTYLSVYGTVYASGAKILGWDSAAGTPSAFKDSKEFRPFLAFWKGSSAFLAGNSFENLGFFGPKAYGLSFATNTFSEFVPDLRDGTIWLVENAFSELYYGLYTLGVSGLRVVGNTYDRNIANAIDPHDGSENLLIARNKVTGTVEKHGILLSGDIRNSWVVQNEVSRNAGSGIVLERGSTGNLVAFNTVSDNAGDGVAFYESSDNLGWKNMISRNGRDGIRIRNSNDIRIRHDKVLKNGGFGVETYSADGEDFSFAPSTLDIAFVEMTGNEGGQFKFSGVDKALFYDVRVFDTPGDVFRGDLASYEKAIRQSLFSRDTGLKLEKIANDNNEKLSEKERSQ